MNQKEQILQVLSRALSTFRALSTLIQNTTAQYIIKEQIRDLNKAIAYVKETPEYEPAPLVRLTEKELLKAYTTAENQKLVWQVDRERYLRHAKIIMDAIELKNRGAE